VFIDRANWLGHYTARGYLTARLKMSQFLFVVTCTALPPENINYWLLWSAAQLQQKHSQPAGKLFAFFRLITSFWALVWSVAVV